MKKLIYVILSVLLFFGCEEYYTDADKIYSEDKKLCGLFTGMNLVAFSGLVEDENQAAANLKELYRETDPQIFETGVRVFQAVSDYFEHFLDDNGFYYMKFQSKAPLMISFILEELSQDKAIGLELYLKSKYDKVHCHSIAAFKCVRGKNGYFIFYSDPDDGVNRLGTLEFVFNGAQWQCVTSPYSGYTIGFAVSLNNFNAV